MGQHHVEARQEGGSGASAGIDGRQRQEARERLLHLQPLLVSHQQQPKAIHSPGATLFVEYRKASEKNGYKCLFIMSMLCCPGDCYNQVTVRRRDLPTRIPDFSSEQAPHGSAWQAQRTASEV